MLKVLIGLFTLVSSVASASVPWYFSSLYADGFVGVNIAEDERAFGGKADLDVGYAAGVAVGYRYSKFFRTEIEAAYRANHFEHLRLDRFQGLPTLDPYIKAEGRALKVTLLGNFILDYPLCGCDFVPYAGVGFGYCWDRENIRNYVIHENNQSIAAVYPGQKRRSNDFAGQILVGATFWKWRHMQSALEYRYLNGGGIVGNHTIDLNLQWNF